MIAAEQIKSLINSFKDGDDSRFYATAMQIAAAEARKGNAVLAEEIKKLIESAKVSKKTMQGVIKKLPVNNAQRELNDLLELIHPEVKLSDMVLASRVKQSIQRVLDEQKQIELLRQHNLFPRKKLLLTGPPGCGKTMTAEVVAKELGLPLFIIRLDGLISRYMGESISKLRVVFDAMQEFRAVYLFDEFDSIGTTRNQGNEVGEIKRVLNSFLLQIEKDSSNSLIIAATNIPEALDNALFRRFDDIINYPLPDIDQIRILYNKLLADIIKTKKISLDKLSIESVGLSYSDINKICQDFSKDILVYGTVKATPALLFDYIKSRKTPF